MRLIDADAINTKTFVDFVGNQGYISFGDALWMISELPTIEAVPVVHAEWEYHWFDSICSNCGYRNKADSVTRMRDDHNFCPACGARMDGKKVE
jgi:NADH pyrophosphatase NudC (nudix superfamily)